MKDFSLNNLIGFIVPLLTVIVVVGSIPVVILPQLDRIRLKSADLSKKEEKFKKLEAKAKTLEQINVENLDDRVENAEIALPSGKNLAPLIDAIKKLSGDSKLIVNSIRLKPGKVATTSATTTEDKTSSQPRTAAQGTTKVVLPTGRTDLLLNLELKGAMKDFQSFLKFLERAKRILIVVSSSSSVESDGSIIHTLVLNAPFKPLKSNFNDVETEPIPVENENLARIYDILNDDFIEYSKPIVGADCPTCTGVTNPFP